MLFKHVSRLCRVDQMISDDQDRFGALAWNGEPHQHQEPTKKVKPSLGRHRHAFGVSSLCSLSHFAVHFARPVRRRFRGVAVGRTPWKSREPSEFSGPKGWDRWDG